MRNVAKSSDENLRTLFSNVAPKAGLSPAIIEKDFWVCWMLDYLFNRSPWTRQLAFKGGTSLSKAYGLIKRFSEDIDLIVDWRLLGYGLNEPWEPRSNTQQDIFNVKANGCVKARRTPPSGIRTSSMKSSRSSASSTAARGRITNGLHAEKFN